MDELAEFIDLAKNNSNIIAIGTEGASNNTAATHDVWTDLDITVFAADPDQEDGQAWIRHFGQPTIVQQLDDQGLFGDTGHWTSFLTRYAGTKRIDFKLAPAADINAYLAGDTLNTLIWTRQDGKVAPRLTSGESHNLTLPNQKKFDAHVNQLYWIAGNVVKGLARRNLVYANEQFNQELRPELLYLMALQEASQLPNGFDPGANYKYLPAVLSNQRRGQLANTYNQSTLVDTLAALRTAINLAEIYIRNDAAALKLEVPDFVTRAVTQLTQWLVALAQQLTPEEGPDAISRHD